VREIVNIPLAPGEEFKILLYGDTHMRFSDYSTVRNYVTVSELNLSTIVELNRQHKIDCNIHLGDAYDGGYDGIGRDRRHQSLWKAVQDSVRYFYLNIGNHILIDRDSNPEMYLIQPSAKYKSSEATFEEQQFFKTPDEVVIGGKIQISLFHYDPKNKEYVSPRLDGVEHRIAVYHDECMIPPNVKKRLGMEASLGTTYFERMFDDIDYAVFGDLHIPQPSTTFTKANGSKVVFDIPGSPNITTSDIRYRHPSINMPLLTLKDGTVSISYIKFDTNISKYTFVTKAVEPGAEVRKSLRDRNKEIVRSSPVTYTTLFEFYDKHPNGAAFKELSKLFITGEHSLANVLERSSNV